MFTGKRVLSIDDSKAIRAFLSTLLASHGAHVDEAGNGDEALLAHRENPPYDLILLDLLLPDTDGMEILRQMRMQEHDSTIVVLTGVGGVASAISAMQLGADGYIEKQHLTGRRGEPEFFYALQQAMEHRAGIVAQRELQQLRTDFYSMVTHDLRNPAGTVLALLKLVLAGKAGPVTAQQEELLTKAQRAANKFVNLITQYLDYSKIEAGYLQLEKQETDIAQIVRASAEEAEVQARAKGQRVVVDVPQTPITCLADPEKLEQVFDNLLSNAVKYTPDNGTITMRLHQNDPPRHQIQIDVSDTGHGMSKAQVQTLFTKYHRIPGDASRGVVGTGLGLLIVKEIVEAHNGTVRAESSPAGSTFTVTLPCQTSAI